tara:strand:+ start:413 stop:997 length:585 start_codon:yes stop_codon:yes gene_type:complete
MNTKSEITEELKSKIIEAYIFASKDPVHISKLQFFENNKSNLLKIIKKLQNKYITSGINLINIENSFAFRTSEEVSELLNFEQEIKKPLSRAASETLAIIAYHQPITRAKIENIRGVTLSKGTLDLLFEIGWIKPGKRLETPGRPITWETTIDFLDHFGLSKISDLPGIEELKESGLLNEDKTFFSDPENDQED